MPICPRTYLDSAERVRFTFNFPLKAPELLQVGLAQFLKLFFNHDTMLLLGPSAQYEAIRMKPDYPAHVCGGFCRKDGALYKVLYADAIGLSFLHGTLTCT